LSEINALKTWNYDDPTYLFQLLSDIINIRFKLYQEDKLLKFSKKNVLDEYIELKETYIDENLQVYVNNGLDYVSINLTVNLNNKIVSFFLIVVVEIYFIFC
jgi:hypothetical protein